MRRFLASATWGALLALIVGASAIAAVGDLGEQRRISVTGPEDDRGYATSHVRVAYNPTRNQYLAVWAATINADGKFEIFGRLLGPGGSPISEQFRLSTMGPEADSDYGARRPTVAYNAETDEYLVTWVGDDNAGTLADNEIEVYVQRVSGTGAEVGTDDQRISSMGPDGNENYDAADPAVTFNRATNEYLVVWSGDDDRFQLQDEEFEIFAQRISASGAEVGTDDARISTVGLFQNPAFDALMPTAAYNPTANEYLVAWYADDQSPTQVNDEYEIFVQRLSATGDQVGTDDQAVSAMGPDRDNTTGAYEAAVAYNATADEYLLAWSAYDSPPLDPTENEIFIQRLTSTGAEVGADDQRISSMGTDGVSGFNAFSPTVAFNSSANEYVVAFQGNDGAPPLAEDESELYAQRLSAAGDEVGPDDQRISQMGPDGDNGFFVFEPDAEYNPTTGEYLFAWQGSDEVPQNGTSESEAYARSMATADPPADPPGAPADTTLAGASLDLAKKLKIKGKELKIKLEAGCAEACTAAAAGAVTVKPGKGKLAAKAKRLKLAPATASIAAGQTTKLTLKLKGSKAKRKKLTRKLVGAVRGGAKAKASIAVTLTDGAGNAAVVDDAAKLKAK